MSPNGGCLTIGSFGHEDSDLDHPSDVAVDDSGLIYVADTDNQRVVILDSKGTFVRQFGGAGPYPGLFHTPTGIRYFNGELFVADSGNHRIQVFDLNGNYKYEWGVHALLPHEGQGKLHYPNQIAIAPSGRFAAVLESFEDRIQIFGPETEESRVLQQSQEKSMAAQFGAAIATAGSTMAVLEPSTPSILLWDVAGDEPIELSRFGRYGTKAGTFIRPEGVALDPEARRAFVVDPGQMTISVLDVTRPKEEGLRYLPELVHFVKSLDVRAIDDPTRPIWPIEPTAIRFGPRRDLWILDAANRRVVVFDEKLKFLRAIASEETSAVSSETNQGGSMELASDSHHRADFHELALPLLEPTDLALSPSGDILYVVDAARGHICAFSTSPSASSTSPAPKGASSDQPGGMVRIIGRVGTGPTDFVRPFGIAVAPDGDIYVTDDAEHKVVRFDPTGAPKQSFGKRGLGRVEFFKPKGITFDAKGELLVLDWGNHRGQVLTRDGEFVRAFGSRVFVVPTLKKP
jgi:DNA-binding beta-propeller fold protein YncE